MIGEYERAFYGSQYASMAPLLEHYGIQLRLPEAGAPVGRSEHHEQLMLAIGLQSKREIARTRIRGSDRDGRPDPRAGPVPERPPALRAPAR